MPPTRLEAGEHSVQVDVDHLCTFSPRELLEPAVALDPSVVDQHIEGPTLSDETVEELVHRLVIGHIQWAVVNPPGTIGCVPGMDIGGNHAETAIRQEARDLPSDTGCATGDHRSGSFILQRHFLQDSKPGRWRTVRGVPTTPMPVGSARLDMHRPDMLQRWASTRTRAHWSGSSPRH